MIKKNIPTGFSAFHSSPSIAIQTDDFLVFLPFEEQLSNLLEKYRNLQSDFEEVKNKLEYYQFKNKMLESSLHELTFIFTNKMLEERTKCMDEIKVLDEMIAR